MKTTQVKMKVGNTVFVADVPAVESSTGKLFADGEAIVRMEQAVAAWIIQHGTDGPESLRILRSAAGLTGSQLAELLNVDRARVSEWENAKAHPGRALFATVAALARDAIAGRSDTADYLRAMHAPDNERMEIKLAVG
jgi:DNA-binding transcriptional regulator YiaG